MIRIAITWPDFFDGEAERIASLLNNDADDCSSASFHRIHIRKPNASKEKVVALLSAIPSIYHPNLVLHDYFELIDEFPSIGGVHLNRRNPVAKKPLHGKTISRSCHSLDEVVKYKTDCDYVFLSPIFDSISKNGYQSAFSPDVICQAVKKGIIDQKVYALGGVSPDKINLLQSWNFGGYAMLGSVWKEFIKK